ncbi:creatininase family protein [soil metagenome]
MGTWRTTELGRMSWSEVGEAISQQPVILLPIGTVEQHGPHLPVNADNMVAEYVALAAAKETHSLVAPGINYGNSALFTGFPGTFHVKQETLKAVLTDVCEEFVAHGFRRIIFVNNHGGNDAVCEAVARSLKAAYGIYIGVIYPWSLGYGLMRDTYDDWQKAYGHGAEPETSAMLGMFPEDVVESRRESGTIHPFAGWQVDGYSKVTVPGTPAPATIYFESHEVAPNGVTGDGSVATPERGQIWIDRVVGHAVAFVNEYDRLTKDAEWAKPVPSRHLVGVVAPE